MIPVFDVIPVIQSRNSVRIALARIAGISTKHTSTHTDAGRMYGDITSLGGGSYRLDLFSDYARAGGSLVARGTGAIGQYFPLAAQNASGLSGLVRLEGDYDGTASPSILIPTFATDVDVFKDITDATAMPGYDATYGLAAFFAAAMRRILTSDLPGALPDLYRGAKLAAFTPLAVGAELPDLSNIEAPDALRDATANLVKSLSAREAEHTAEFADMSDAALVRYNAALATFTAANAPAATDAKAAGSGFSIGSFTRV